MYDVPLLLVGIWMVLSGSLLAFIDSPSVPEIVTIIVGIALLVWADRMSKRQAGH